MATPVPCGATCTYIDTEAACVACDACAWLADICGRSPTRPQGWMDGSNGRAVLIDWTADPSLNTTARWLLAWTVILFASACILLVWGMYHQHHRVQIKSALDQAGVATDQKEKVALAPAAPHTTMKHPMRGQDTVIVEDVADYRAAIPSLVHPGDCVLEVGCHEGVTTRRIAHEVGDDGVVIGIDTSEVCIERANCAYRNQTNLRFLVGDAMNVSELKALPPRPYDVIFLDISGSRDLETLIPVMNAYEFALKPRTLVVKSFRLKRLFVNCRLFEHIPAAPGQKGGKVDTQDAAEASEGGAHSQTQGQGEWSLVVPQPRFPLEVSKRTRHAKGVLPTDDAGSIDRGQLQANAKCNKSLQAWGKGRETRRLRQVKKKELRAQDAENNTAESAKLAQRNVLFQAETNGRAGIERQWKNEIVGLGKENRTRLKHAAKAAGESCRAVVHWSRALGPLTWTVRGADEASPASASPAHVDPNA